MAGVLTYHSLLYLRVSLRSSLISFFGLLLSFLKNAFSKALVNWSNSFFWFTLKREGLMGSRA